MHGHAFGALRTLAGNHWILGAFRLLAVEQRAFCALRPLAIGRRAFHLLDAHAVAPFLLRPIERIVCTPPAPVEQLPEQPAPARPEGRPAEAAAFAAPPPIEDPSQPAAPSGEDHLRSAALAVPEPPALMVPASSPGWDRPQPRAFDGTLAPPAQYRSVARHRATVPIPQAEPEPTSSEPAVPAIPRPEPPASAIPAAPLTGSRSRSADLPAAAAWIVLDSGEREPVDAVLVLGRAPTSSDPSHRLVTVTDPTRSLSRTHLRLGPAGRGGVWAEDMFSSNGTVLRLADGTTRHLPRGERVELDLGSALVIGERTLTIT